MHMTNPIQYTQEFHFADHVTQHWAFEHPDSWANWQTVAEHDFPDRRWFAEVLSNTGEILKVPVTIENFTVKPICADKTAYIKVGKNYETRYLISGHTFSDTAAVWITEADFYASPDIIKITRELNTALQKFSQKHTEELRRVLAKSAAPSTSTARTELPAIIKSTGILSWFVSHGFACADLKEIDFKPFKDTFLASGIMVHSWIIIDADDVAVTVTIDWHKKKITLNHVKVYNSEA